MKLHKRIYFKNIDDMNNYKNDDYNLIYHFEKLFINLYYKTFRKFKNESFENYSDIGNYDTLTYIKSRHKI